MVVLEGTAQPAAPAGSIASDRRRHDPARPDPHQIMPCTGAAPAHERFSYYYLERSRRRD